MPGQRATTVCAHRNFRAPWAKGATGRPEGASDDRGNGARRNRRIGPGDRGACLVVFLVFSLSDCAPTGSGWGHRELLSSRISCQALRLHRSTAARPKFSSFAECRQSSQQRERRWQRLAATSDSLHTGLIVARSRFFRLCGTMAKGPATGQLLATACGTRDSLRTGQAMAGSRVFRVCGKTAGRVGIRRWGLGWPRGRMCRRRRMAPHPAAGHGPGGTGKKKSRA